MIRTVLTLQVRDSKVHDVLTMYKDEDILQYSLDNSRALASEISVASDGSGKVMVTALWPDSEAYDGWLNHPNRADSAPRLAALITDVEVGAGDIFEIHHSVTK